MLLRAKIADVPAKHRVLAVCVCMLVTQPMAHFLSEIGNKCANTYAFEWTPQHWL